MRLPVIFVLLAALLVAAGQAPVPPAPEPPEPADIRLPSGKSQRAEIVRADHKKSLEDSREMIRLAEELRSELEKNDYLVVSVSEIRKTEEIEKLARRIRGRLKRF